MNCPYCTSTQIRKNGHRRGKQNYICVNCARQFIESYSKRGYSDEIRKQCLTMYVNGVGFRAIERQTGVNHNTIIQWVRIAAKQLSNAPCSFRNSRSNPNWWVRDFYPKKNKIWLWRAVNKSCPGILAWVLGERSARTFEKLWRIIRCWKSYFYVTDGYPVYPCFIDDEDHIVKKTYMTRCCCERIQD